MERPLCFLVDDDQDDREIFEIALENASSSYRCISAKNGVDALDIINNDINFDPDFIFIDLNMPYLSGKECLKAIKDNKRFESTPVIIYTTSSYGKDIEETKKLGASHFIVKPPGITGLANMLAAVLNKEDLPYLLE